MTGPNPEPAGIDPEELAERLEREVANLERRSGKLQEQVELARGDWERKRDDDNVPGAPPREDGDD